MTRERGREGDREILQVCSRQGECEMEINSDKLKQTN